MAGQWETQNKVIPGVYVNFKTNAPLSITPGERGTVVILQEVSTGTKGDMYKLTLTDQSAWPKAATSADKKLANEALKNAKTVIVHNLGATREAAAVTAALAKLKTIDFDVLCFPYDAVTDATIKTSIATWIKGTREEGYCVVAVLANSISDSEGVINVAQGVKLSATETLTAAQASAWVAGATAGAGVNQSLTGKTYTGAIDVDTRLSKTEMEAAITAGKFIFKVDKNQNVTCACDINSLTTVTAEKSKMFQKNRVVRCLDGINNDITEIFESNFIGKVNNNADGRSLLKGMLVDYFNELQSLSAIQNFNPDDIVVSAGTDIDAVVVDAAIQPVDSVEKIYITVNLA